MNTIPQLDISDFNSHRTEFVAQFGAAYQQWGFAGITGHGLEPDLIQAAFNTARDFFALAEDQKMAYESTTLGKSRGYIPFGTEKAKDSDYSDLKEFYHVGREVAGVAHLSANVWPTEISEFREVFGSLYGALDQLAQKVLQVVAVYLELPIDYFKLKVNHGEALLRILHYPPIVDQQTPHLRAAAHEDINLMTLLVGSEQDGLEVLSRRGEWVPINMIEGTIVCNVGDMLQRLTNKKLPSTTHRVVNPKGDKARSSRYSIPFFMHPNPDASLACLPQCVDQDHPLLYAPTTADAYLQQRLRQIGLLK
jgi:isopenicillin N synthase-like dioxygenase